MFCSPKTSLKTQTILTRLVKPETSSASFWHELLFTIVHYALFVPLKFYLRYAARVLFFDHCNTVNNTSDYPITLNHSWRWDCHCAVRHFSHPLLVSQLAFFLLSTQRTKSRQRFGNLIQYLRVTPCLIICLCGDWDVCPDSITPVPSSTLLELDSEYCLSRQRY